jgi:hypothetical protein
LTLFNDPVHNPSDSDGNCTICHGANGTDVFHFNDHTLADAYNVTWNNTPANFTEGAANCTLCHETWNGLDPFNAPSPIPKHNATGVTVDECYGCHTNSSNYSEYPAALHNITGTPPPEGCTACHAVGANITTTHIDIAAFSSMDNKTLHGDINQDSTRSNNSDCMLCHYGLDGMGIGWQVNSSTTRNCTWCHFYGNVSQAPRMYGHAPEFYGVVSMNAQVDPWTPPTVNTTNPPVVPWVNYNTGLFNGTEVVFSGDNKLGYYKSMGESCTLCHNNSVAPSNDTDLVNATSNVSHYGTNASLKISDGNTTKCIYCHKNQAQGGYVDHATEGPKWGLQSGAAVVMGDNDEDCWECHLATNVNLNPGDTVNPPTDFHKADITTFMWNCQRCHPV